ncbi:ribbon-helix-helix domain-containing protein [Spirosoma sp.]|uniref:ribbon-helix-helix domain-containing protein n=1 Tax=Spirosoma sp. TaxID=1899569 RepID=UPI003B3AC4B4
MATEKKAFVLRIQPEMLKELERWAQEEFRSVNGQIEFLLNDALRKRRKHSADTLPAKTSSQKDMLSDDQLGALS